jgi:hypothetical protein
MNQNEIKNLVSKGFRPCFFSGVRENGGVFNEKNGAWNETTGVFLHGVASIGDAEFKSEITGRGESMCGYLFASRVTDASEFGRLGIRSIVWYGDQGFEEVNARKTFTRGAGATGTGAQASTGAAQPATAPTPAAGPAVASAPAAPATGAAPTAAPASVGTTPGAAQAQAVGAPGVDASGLLGAFIGSLAPAIVPAVTAQILPQIETIVAANTKVVDYRFTLPDASEVTISGAHKMLPDVMDVIKLGFIPYLLGPAGSGKGTLAKHVAKAMNLPFLYIGRVFNAYDLTGFIAADGKPVETVLTKAVKNGGILLADEFDSWEKEACEAINEGLSSGLWSFPGVGTIEAHPDFHLIMAGNTAGRGSNCGYIREPLDPATIDRVATLVVNYDEDIELASCLGDRELLDFFHSLRAASYACEIGVSTSPRAMLRLAKFTRLGWDLHKALIASFVSDLGADSLRMLSGRLTGSDKYTQAFKTLQAVKY